MSIVERVYSTREKVEQYLKQDKKYRDDDEKLVARYWGEEIIEMGYNLNELSAYGVLCFYATKKLTSSSLIERARRKLQEEFPELRGEKWLERQDKAIKTKETINN